MEANLFELFTKLPIIASFLAGIITFLSPCILPLIPAYISYISGISVEQFQNLSSLDSEISKRKARFIIFGKTLAFVLGFCVVFVILGLFFGSFLGQLLTSIWFRYFAGALVVIFGIHFLGIFRIKLFYKISPSLNFRNLNARFSNSRFFSIIAPFLLGVSFAACWTPCAGPILASILALGMADSANALLYICAYALGLGFSFLLTSLLVERAIEFFKKIKKFMRVLEVIAAILLIFLGYMIFSGQLGFLSANMNAF